MIYLGFKEDQEPELIENDKAPTEENYPQYDFFHGPFNTKEDAEKYVKAMTGFVGIEG